MREVALTAAVGFLGLVLGRVRHRAAADVAAPLAGSTELIAVDADARRRLHVHLRLELVVRLDGRGARGLRTRGATRQEQGRESENVSHLERMPNVAERSNRRDADPCVQLWSTRPMTDSWEAEGLPRPGSVLLDRYRLDEAVARGGMSMVYRGHDLEESRRVAIKVLPQRLRTERSHARFLREARCRAATPRPASWRSRHCSAKG